MCACEGGQEGDGRVSCLGPWVGTVWSGVWWIGRRNAEPTEPPQAAHSPPAPGGVPICHVQSYATAAPTGTQQHQLHYELVNAQLSQLRTELVLSRALGGAAAVLPRFFCAADQGSTQDDGRIEQSKLDMPFECPADHILNMRR